MRQFSLEQAQAISKSRIWESWSDIELLRFQLFQNNLCMPFGKYHTALEKYLGRPVYTHTLDFNKDILIKEVIGSSEPPTFEELLSLIPLDVLNHGSVPSRSNA